MKKTTASVLAQLETELQKKDIRAYEEPHYLDVMVYPQPDASGEMVHGMAFGFANSTFGYNTTYEDGDVGNAHNFPDTSTDSPIEHLVSLVLVAAQREKLTLRKFIRVHVGTHAQNGTVTVLFPRNGDVLIEEYQLDDPDPSNTDDAEFRLLAEQSDMDETNIDL